MKEDLSGLWAGFKGSPMNPHRFVRFHRIGAGLIILVSALISISAVVQKPEVIYPPNAPKIISDYGDLVTPTGRRRAEANPVIEIGGNAGDSVLAAADGEVVVSEWSAGRGYYIRILHGKDSDGSYLFTGYIHNAENLAKVGEQVKRGQIIAKIGATGRGATGESPQLHFSTARSPTAKFNQNTATFVNSHEYWVEGPYRIACFNPRKIYETSHVKFTYPIECKQ